MWILPLIGYIGVIFGFAFLTLAIASGLYYLSELVEEYTVFSKKLLYRLIYGIIIFQILLLVVDRFPVWLSVIAIVSHGVYMQNLRQFPVVKLHDPIFILSCVLVLVNHWLWYQHFSKPPPYSPSSSSYPYKRITSYNLNVQPSFTEIAAFFGLCVWLVPFSLFVSLSASDNVLPTHIGSGHGDGMVSTPGGSQIHSNGGLPGARGSSGKAGMAKALVDGFRGWVSESAELMGVTRGERTRHRF